jgi:hypothetical protein
LGTLTLLPIELLRITPSDCTSTSPPFFVSNFGVCYAAIWYPTQSPWFQWLYSLGSQLHGVGRTTTVDMGLSWALLHLWCQMQPLPNLTMALCFSSLGVCNTK